jgi:hypothetical protein
MYRVFVGKPDGKKLLGRPNHRWEDIIRMGLQEVAKWHVEVWTGLGWPMIGTGGGHL